MRTHLLQIRLSNEEKELCQRKADLAGCKSLSEWARIQFLLDQPARANRSKPIEPPKPVAGNPYPNAVLPVGVAPMISDEEIARMAREFAEEVGD